jgi:hypothetical protein
MYYEYLIAFDNKPRIHEHKKKAFYTNLCGLGFMAFGT